MRKAYVGSGKNKIDFEITEDQAAKIIRIQKHLRLQREEKELAERENREPRPVKY